MEGKNIANRSKQNYTVPNSIGVSGMAVCEDGTSIAATVQDGSIIVLKLETSSSRFAICVQY